MKSELEQHPYGESFLRGNPFSKFSTNGNLKNFILDLAEKIKKDEITNEELVTFFKSHKLIFDNERTGAPSSNFFEPEYSPEKVRFIGVVSCSCLCGPLSEPCNQEGPGSKFTFKR